MASISVSDSRTHHRLVLFEPISKHLPLQCSRDRGADKTLRGGGGRGVEGGGDRSYHLLQWREFVNCTSNRESGHAGLTNQSQRNEATYDISAGLGWQLPAWGSCSLGRQTEGTEWHSRHQWYKNLCLHAFWICPFQLGGHKDGGSSLIKLNHLRMISPGKCADADWKWLIFHIRIKDVGCA